MLPNLLAYLEYPFVPRLGEPVSVVLVPDPLPIAHLALFGVLAIVMTWKAARASLLVHLVFPLPALSTPGTSSHDLNASALALS